MMVDRMDWKILAFEVGKISFFECWTVISDGQLWNFFALYTPVPETQEFFSHFSLQLQKALAY